MKIVVLAPYSRPWDLQDSEGSGMNPFIRESVEAISSVVDEVHVFVRRSRSTDKLVSKILKNVFLHTIPAGNEVRMSREQTYFSCKENEFPVDLIKDCDFIISHYWVSEPWIDKIFRYREGKCVFYFSHALSWNKYRLQSSSQLALDAELSLAHKVVWCAYSRDEYRQVLEHVPDTKILYIKPGSRCYQVKGERKRNKIFFVGRKNTAKGYDLFVQLATENPRYQFVSVGREEGDFLVPINISNLQFVPLNNLFDRINEEARLIICPSRYEHFGLMPLVGNCLGVPIIASNAGGHSDVVKEGQNGYLFKPGNYQDLLDKFMKFVNLDDYTYPSDVQEWVKDNFSWHRHAEGLIKEYKYTLGGES
jgi:glycosyltransferase involved in cell wall biosynthesis